MPSFHKEGGSIITNKTKDKIMNEFNILKNKGVGAFIEENDKNIKDIKNSLTTREFNRFKREVKAYIVNEYPFTKIVSYHYDKNHMPKEVINNLEYAKEIEALVKVKQAGLITEEQFLNIKKRLQNRYKICSDMVI